MRRPKVSFGSEFSLSGQQHALTGAQSVLSRLGHKRSWRGDGTPRCSGSSGSALHIGSQRGANHATTCSCARYGILGGVKGCSRTSAARLAVFHGKGMAGNEHAFATFPRETFTSACGVLPVSQMIADSWNATPMRAWLQMPMIRCKGIYQALEDHEPGCLSRPLNVPAAVRRHRRLAIRARGCLTSTPPSR